MKSRLGYIALVISALLIHFAGYSQNWTLSGYIMDQKTRTPLENVAVFLSDSSKVTYSSQDGYYVLAELRKGRHKVEFSLLGYKTKARFIKLEEDIKLNIFLVQETFSLPNAEVNSKEETSNLERMPSVQSTGIYRGMKSEVLRPAEMNINLSTNNSRQAYAKVPGINTWENDGAGIQLGIGARGLSPNRTSHFNVRQNLYDISADALGYPESYYTPPLESVEKIEIIRGASALQYGTQFGGLLNFKMRSGAPDEKMKVNLKQTIGTFGLADSITPALAFSSSLMSVGGTIGKTNYYGFYQYKTGSGWRPNSGFDVHMAYGKVSHQFGEKLTLGVEVTHMNYLAQQAGGLTDKAFKLNARTSNRGRNWFRVKWNLAAVHLSYKFSPMTELTSQAFGLSASREALGFLGETQRLDPLVERDLIYGKFQNFGNESRLIHKIIKDEKLWVLAGGVRLYHGQNNTRQGSGSDEYDANFSFVSRTDLSESNYDFPNYNAATFAQAIIPLSRYLSITPGVRYEFISTNSRGSYNTILFDGAGNLIESQVINDNKTRTRDFVLFGGGLSYKKSDNFELYANAVQNYRAINFSDLQIRNTSLVIDSLIQDERGYNADIGVRGLWKKHLRFDISVFALIYNDRIGEVNRTFNLLGVRRYRTNISDARSLGVELFSELDILATLDNDSSHWSASIFTNLSFINAQYSNRDDDFYFGKKVELVPVYTMIFGAHFGYKQYSVRLQYSRTGAQFSDASNVGANPEFPATINAVDGIIPAYKVVDATLGWASGQWKIQFSLNNALDSKYFTRRASGYPGPGIIPSDGRSVYLSVGIAI